jgi:predicted RNA-binding Zn-ribbon protein involved in translation (DUF1610 family)
MSGVREQTEAAAIYDRIRRNSSKEHCPFCGDRDWFVLDVPGDETVAVVSRRGEVPTYTLICENCGFLRQHARDVVDGRIGKRAG